MSLARTLLEKYSLENISCSSNAKAISDALTVMKMVESDGKAIQIAHHDYLFVGSIGAAYNIETIIEQGITHIICATPSSRLRFPDRVKYLRVPIQDKVEENIASYFDSTSGFIEQARIDGGKIMIHCFQVSTVL
mmetsp:Transcript_24679/g.36185  ORF Transcript_24679/g.36185 Transcript_24679/m.36185 type:complete len:135 (-) Transcript_24679:561-965(-)